MSEELRFDLKRPCANCPFSRKQFGFLTRGRAAEIAHGLIDLQGTFSCHKTNVHAEEEDDEDGEEGDRVTFEPQHCAGAAIFLEKMNRPNQWMRINERFIDKTTGKPYYERESMDLNADVFASRREFIEHHAKGVTSTTRTSKTGVTRTKRKAQAMRGKKS